MAKIYIDNAKVMEFVDTIATDYTTLNYGADTWVETEDSLEFSEEAQEYYTEVYDEVESMLNNILDIHSNNDFKGK